MIIVNSILIIAFGLVIGSFLGALTWRIPNNISINDGRSICPRCKNKICWYDNIPVISFLLLGGKCRNCQKKISARYPFIEITTSLFFLFTYLGLPQITGNLPWLSSSQITNYILLITINTLLLCLLIIDLEHQILPDQFIFAGITFVILGFFKSDFPRIYSHLLTGFSMSLVFLFLHAVTRGKGMGLGDVKLALLIGLALGFKLSLVWFLLSFVLGAFVGLLLIFLKKAEFGKHIAFGPFMIIAYFIVIFWGNSIQAIIMPYL